LPFCVDEFDGLTEGLIAVSPNTEIAALFPRSFYAMVSARDSPGNFPSIACAPVHYATPADRQRYDIVQSIRTLTLLRERHAEKRSGGRFHFRTTAEMTDGCKEHQDWLRHTVEI